MSPTRTTLLLLAIAIGLGVWVWFDLKNKPGLDDDSYAWPLLRDFPADKVTRIELDRPGKTGNREKLVFERDGKDWRMLEPLQEPAAGHVMQTFVEQCTSMPPQVQIAAENLASYGLDAGATRLTLIHPGGAGRILVGRTSNIGGTVYAMAEGAPKAGMMDAGFEKTLSMSVERYLARNNPNPRQPATQPPNFQP